MTWLHFEVKRSKVKATARPNVVKYALWEAYLACVNCTKFTT